MIKYCCYYCKHLKSDKCVKCYPALGGKEYIIYCQVKDGECDETITNNGKMADAHKECWELSK